MTFPAELLPREQRAMVAGAELIRLRAGEISLIDGCPRTHDATALGPAEVLALPRAALRNRPMRGALCRCRRKRSR
jgi:hypothetical protein